jgi:hypothetical protein
MVMRTGLAMAGLSLAATLGLSAPVAAKVTIYDCSFEFSRSRGGGWIPQQLILTDNDQNGEILAYDNVIKDFVGKPIPARRSAQTAARVTYVWKLEARNKGQSSLMTYTFSYLNNGQPAKMRAQPGGYDNVWTGEGTCKVGTK